MSLRRQAAAWRLGCALGLLGLVVGGCGEPPADKVRAADPATRIQGLHELAEQDTEPALDAAAEAIAHEDLSTARAAVRAVGRMSHRRVVAVLARAAAENPRPEIREEALLALSYGTEPSAADTMRQVIRAAPEPRVRAAAAIGIGRVGTLDDVERLLDIAQRDPDPLVKGHAVGALERLLGIGFTFDPHAAPDDRQVTLERVRIAAMIRARVLRDQARARPGKAGES